MDEPVSPPTPLRATRLITQSEITIRAYPIAVGSPADRLARAPGPATLSDLHRAVLGRLANGETTREVANQVRRSPKTVEHIEAHLKHRLGLPKRAFLIRYAVQHRLAA